MTAPLVDQSATATAQQTATRESIATYLSLLWSRLTSWRTPDAVQFAASVAPIITGSQQRMAALTAAHLEQLIRAGGGTPGRLDLSGLTDADLRGVPATEVYQRPFRQIWTDLSQGKPLEQAVTSAGHRLQSLAATDLQLAKTNTAQRVLSSGENITGYRRVLNGDRSCALCLIASTQRYHKAKLMPIHPGCDCGVEPLFGDSDPGQVIDPVTLEAVHTAVSRDLGPRYVDRGARSPLDYRNVLITHDHGEIGPVLGVRGQEFTGPPDRVKASAGTGVPAPRRPLIETTPARTYSPAGLVDDYRSRIDVPADERRALFRYTGGEFVGMNDYLRHGKSWANDWAAEPVDALTRLSGRYTLPADITVWRRVQAGSVPGTARPGMVFEDRGFSSTSLTEETTVEFRNYPVVMRINLPTGMPAIVVNGIGNGVQAENELILPPRTRYRIDGDETRDGKRWLTVTAFPPNS